MTHSHYSHVDADRDVNCMFPLDRLRELCDGGAVGGIAPMAYSIMGFNPDPEHLTAETAPVLGQAFKESGADLVLHDMRLTDLPPVRWAGPEPG